MSKKTKLYEGKTKIVYAADDENTVMLDFKDDAVPGDKGKKGKIKGKGIINNTMSCHLFQYLQRYNVPTHFIEQKSDRQMVVKKAEMINIEVCMRNVAAGNLCKRYSIEEGLELETPIVELYLKGDSLNGPLINEYHAYAMKLATREEIQYITKQAIKINAVLKSYFNRRSILLVDFKIEFGRTDNGIILCDEISPDTCRFWDSNTRKKMDKDRFLQDLGDIEKSYKEVLDRTLGSESKSKN
ncbi:phosphoribosylaminoimidazolesuccinocarboxamide synthase [candidate division KSB1 bacterium]